MTTIAYRDGVMAADSGSWIGSSSHGWARKLARGPDGTLYGTSGDAAECAAFLEWVDAGCRGEGPKPSKTSDEKNSFIVLVAPPEGGVEIITHSGRERYPEAEYFAIGAGSATAWGALYVGAAPEKAIEAAKEHGESAFGAVRVVRRNLT